MDKESQILQAAQVLFSQFGLKKVTIDDIAKEAHVSKATIYRHYENKREIFDKVTEVEAEQLIAAIAEAIDQETTAYDKIRAHLLTKLGKLRELVNFYRVTRETWSEHWPSGTEIQYWIMAREKEAVKEILELGNKTGELQVDRVDFTAHLLVVALQSIENPWAIEEYKMPLEDYVDCMLGIVFNGIRKR